MIIISKSRPAIEMILNPIWQYQNLDQWVKNFKTNFVQVILILLKSQPAIKKF